MQIAARGTAVDARLNPERSKHVYVLEGGTNDISGGATGATAWARYQLVAAARKAAGWRVVGVTLTPAQGTGNPNFETERLAFNTLMRASSGVVDAIADFGAAAQLQDPTDTTYYNADKIHLTNVGYAVEAAIASAAIAPLL